VCSDCWRLFSALLPVSGFRLANLGREGESERLVSLEANLIPSAAPPPPLFIMHSRAFCLWNFARAHPELLHLGCARQAWAPGWVRGGSGCAGATPRYKSAALALLLLALGARSFSICVSAKSVAGSKRSRFADAAARWYVVISNAASKYIVWALIDQKSARR